MSSGLTENEARAQMVAAANRLVANTMLNRQRIWSHMLDPRRDIYAECGFPKHLLPEMYEDAYDRNGIAERVVHALPDESWVLPPEVYETEDVAETQFELALKSLDRRINLFGNLWRADRLAGVGHYGGILLGYDDGADLSLPPDGFDVGAFVGDELTRNARPLVNAAPRDENGQSLRKAKPQAGASKGAGTERAARAASAWTPKRNLIYMRPFREKYAQIATWCQDPKSARFGKPETYMLTLFDPNNETHTGQGQPQNTIHVHWTRFLHIADNRQGSDVFGKPRMKPVFNYLQSLDKIAAASGEMFWLGARPGYSFEVNPDIPDAELDEEKLRKEFDAFANGLQRYLGLTGVSAKSLAPQVSDPTPHVKMLLTLIAITLGYPLRIFMGTEEAKKAGEQDDKHWNRRLKHRQDTFVTPCQLRPLFELLVALEVLPGINGPDGLMVAWPDLSTVSDLEKSEIMLNKTQAMASYVGGGVDALVAPPSYLRLYAGHTEAEAEAIEAEATDHVAATAEHDAAVAAQQSDLAAESAGKTAAAVAAAQAQAAAAAPQPPEA